MSCVFLLQADSGVRQELNSGHVDERQSPTDNERRRRRYSSPGEELVYREMMEHKAREKELRRHWKEVRLSSIFNDSAVATLRRRQTLTQLLYHKHHIRLKAP